MIIQAIKKAERVLIVGHQRPDGDCIGAGLAVWQICKVQNKQVDFACDSPAPAHFSFLPNYEACFTEPSGAYDLAIAVDCADDLRLGRWIGYFQKARETINIDHHRTNNHFASHNFVYPQASSTCEVLYDLLHEEGVIDATVAYYLMMGLSTDTGHFMHANVTPHVFKVAHALSAFGLDINKLADNLYKNNTPEKTKLIARAIQSMRYFADGKICLITVFEKDLADCGCVLADTEGIIDYGMMIGSVEVAICITEQKAAFKASFRSKTIDVAAAAAVFGGGGHAKAAGCTVSGKYEDVVRKVVKSVTDGMAF